MAVASNFTTTAETLADDYRATGGDVIRIVSGSSGKLYAQITNGAPFELFLSADAERPALLEQNGNAIAGSRRTYALGRLVAWSRVAAVAETGCLAALASLGSGRLAIANPEFAPYGIAAREYLDSAGLWERVQANLVVGENIAQAFQFAATGGAAIGLVAASQLGAGGAPEPACVEVVPADMHAPIEQQLVLLAGAGEDAVAFASYLQSERADRIIVAAGYELPAGAE